MKLHFDGNLFLSQDMLSGAIACIGFTWVSLLLFFLAFAKGQS